VLTGGDDGRWGHALCADDRKVINVNGVRNHAIALRTVGNVGKMEHCHINRTAAFRARFNWAYTETAGHNPSLAITKRQRASRQLREQ
jgi:hypothetical protein